ncbi:prolyl-tRNA editing protein [Candidatus Wirthbacteria bacterium CG2_30_54_11]|uniref:Prolyl-tRNA editing protein n=1 Tax=Candidatus Wirthbacteria bacterium CG2_30_54_11 TaxID=1817892 RepID=A0A1J5IL88_9BACT|nr:MAG: prolyl-tRNA editing protein [Candidatus Wirthbacteria bacterium CG2_30_54_11]
MPDIHPTALKVKNLLHDMGFEIKVLEFPQGTKTSQDAAFCVGCEIAQIAKSIVFRAKIKGDCVIVVASGAHRVDERKVEKLIGEKLSKGDADFVREKTGYVIGGVAPVGHTTVCRTFIDESLLSYEIIYGAAGTPNAVFAMAPADLLKMTGGQVADVKQE